MGRPKKVQEKMLDTFYHAKDTPLACDDELYASGSEAVAIDYLKECEGAVDEVYLYEIKLIGKFRAKYSLEKID